MTVSLESEVCPGALVRNLTVRIFDATLGDQDYLETDRRNGQCGTFPPGEPLP
jgi:hypothetical protein